MEQERGSAKMLRELFGAEGTPTHESLAKSVLAAQDVWKLRRWLVLGQPAPDHIRALFEIEAADVGRFMHDLVMVHSSKVEISCHVLCLGQPRPDVVQMHVDAELNIPRRI